MKKKVTLVLLIMISILGCGGGGNGGGGNSASGSPVLNSVVFSPTSAPHGSIQSFSANFRFTDAEGDLDNGSIKYTYEGSTYSVPLNSSFAGIKSGTGYLSLGSATLSNTIGDIRIPVWLVDKAGHVSNVLNITLRQT